MGRKLVLGRKKLTPKQRANGSARLHPAEPPTKTTRNRRAVMLMYALTTNNVIWNAQRIWEEAPDRRKRYVKPILRVTHEHGVDRIQMLKGKRFGFLFNIGLAHYKIWIHNRTLHLRRLEDEE